MRVLIFGVSDVHALQLHVIHVPGEEGFWARVIYYAVNANLVGERDVSDPLAERAYENNGCGLLSLRDLLVFIIN